MQLSFFDSVQYSIFRSSIGRLIYKYVLQRKCELPNLKYQHSGLKISGISYGDNNYSYMIEHGNECVIIDPGISLEYKSTGNTVILLTHTHWDHCAGIYEMNGVNVYSHGEIGTHRLTDREIVKFGQLEFTTRWIPTHTKCSVIYELRYEEKLHIFTGDSLFNCGTGKFFEGSPEPLIKYIEQLKQYDKESLIWPGHDYFSVNREWCKELNVIVPDLIVPFTIKSQIDYSPFFVPEAYEEKLSAKYGKIKDKTDSVLMLRKWKDEFSPGL
eukprot:NODE_972_length_2665_cov_0.349961.p1 type:complete len:270 gc:universal NODE_972_length_2665_cov_0.349961:1795-986(-)